MAMGRLLAVLALLLALPCLSIGQTQLINSNIVVVGHANSCSATGTVGPPYAYACALDQPITTYVVQACYSFLANANTPGPATVNFNGIGAIPIKKHVNLDLIANDIKANHVVHVCYDGTNMQMQSQTGNQASGTGTVSADAATKTAFYPGSGTTVAGSTGAMFDDTSRLSSKDRVTQKTASATLGLADGPVVRCDTTAGAVILTLPAATTQQGNWLIVKTTTDANTCTVQRGGTDTLNFSTLPMVVTRQSEYVRLDSDGVSNWYAALAVRGVASRSIDFEIGSPAGSALTAGNTTTAYQSVPTACTVTSYSLMITAGTITVKFWRTAAGTAIPTSANSLNTAGVGISTGTAVQSSNLSDFAPSPLVLAANDMVAMNVFAVATAPYVRGSLLCEVQ